MGPATRAYSTAPSRRSTGHTSAMVQAATSGRNLTISDGKTVFVRRPLEEDLANLHALDGATFLYFVSGQPAGPSPTICDCDEACDERGPAVIAATSDGDLIAAAWLHRDKDDPADGKFGLAIRHAYSKAGVTPLVLHELAQQAAWRGVRRMRSCVGRGTRDPLADCRNAGLPVLSLFSLGGVTEVVLAAPTPREAALA